MTDNDTNIHIGTSGETGLKTLETRIDALTMSLGREILKAEAAEKKNLQLSASFKTAATNADTLSVAYNKNESKLASLTTNFNALDSRLTATEASASSYKRQLASVTSENARLSASNKKVSTETKSLNDTFRGAAGGVGKLWLAYGQLLPMMSGLALGSSALQAVKLGAAFEYTTTFVEVLDDAVGSAKVSLTEIQETLLGFDDLRKNASELALGMKEFSKAGVSASEAIGEIEEMARFATLAEIDMGKATELVVGQTNSFGGTFSATANKISAAALSSATTIERMGGAMSYTTELGTVMGFSLDDVATSLALLANKSITGSKAGTSLRTSFMKLLSPSEKAKNMMSELGVEFNALNDDGSIKGLEQQLKEFAAATQGLTEGELAALSRELVGLRALKGFGNLIHDVDKFDAMKEKISESANGVGFLSEKLSELDDTTTARWEKLSVNFSDMLTRMNNPTLVNGAIFGLDSIVSGFSKLAQFPDTVLVAPYMTLVNGVQSIIDAIAGVDTTTLTTTELALKEFADSYIATTEAVDETQSSDHGSWGNTVREALGLLKVGVDEAEDSSERFVEIAKNVRVGMGFLSDTSDLDTNIDESLRSFFDSLDSLSDTDLLEISTENIIKEITAVETAAKELAEEEIKAAEKAEKAIVKSIARATKAYEKEEKAELKRIAKLSKAESEWKQDSLELQATVSASKLNSLNEALAMVDLEYAKKATAMEQELTLMKTLGAEEATLNDARTQRVNDLAAAKEQAIQDEIDSEKEKNGIIVDYSKATEEALRSGYESTISAMLEGESIKEAAIEATYDYAKEIAISYANDLLERTLELAGGWSSIWDSMYSYASSILTSIASWAADVASTWLSSDSSTSSSSDSGSSSGEWVSTGISAGLDIIGSFADGGYHSGGLRVVGEEGPELEYTGSSTIIPNDLTSSLLGGGASSSSSQFLLGNTSALWTLTEANEAASEGLNDNTDATEDHRDATEDAADASDNLSDTTKDNSDTTSLNSEQVSSNSTVTEANNTVTEENNSMLSETIGALAGLTVGIATLAATGSIKTAYDVGVSTYKVVESYVEDNYEGGDGNGGLGEEGGTTGYGDDNDYGDTGGWGDDGDMGTDNEGYAHTGGYLLQAGEGRIIAQTGEGVISRPGMALLDKINSGELLAQREDSTSVGASAERLASAIKSAASESSTQEITIPIYVGDTYLTTKIVTIADKQITMREKQGSPRGVTRI